jgi:hypothetical protein
MGESALPFEENAAESDKSSLSLRLPHSSRGVRAALGDVPPSASRVVVLVNTLPTTTNPRYLYTQLVAPTGSASP